MAETRNRSVWADRFLFGAIVQGTVSFVVMGYLLYLTYITPEGDPSPARVVAGGGAGMWMVAGLIGYALVGVLGIAVSALFYQYLEVTMGAKYAGWRNLCGWAHLVVGGGAASAAALWASFSGLEAGLASIRAGGGAEGGAAAHAVLGPIAEPLGYLMAVALLGFFIGGVGFVTAWFDAWRKERAGATPAAPEDSAASE